MVVFQIPAVLRRFSSGRREVEVRAASVREALARLFESAPAIEARVLDSRGQIHPHLLLLVGGVEVPRDGLDDVSIEPETCLELVAMASGGAHDVRMRGFRDRVPVAEALAVALDGLGPLGPLSVALGEAPGRVLAAPVVSPVAVPPFRRAAMDGYAVHAEDTFGATLYEPVTLALDGESMPGHGSGAAVGRGRACRIMTGAPVPDGADAVLKAEATREEDGRVVVHEPVPPGKNVGRIGEDIAPGDALLAPGRRLRPQDVGLLASIGCVPVPVHAQGRVRILVTGNEIVPPGGKAASHQIIDSNSPMLTALVARDGGGAVEVVRLPDDRDRIREALAAPGADVILTSGGTSVGREDYIPLLVAELGDLLVHGISMRPSSPTGIGRIGAARVFLLPGNPVSCLCAYDFFAGPAIRTLAGLSPDWPHRRVRLPLAGRLVSVIGRTDYARVSLVAGRVQPIAISGASVLSSVTRADGFVILDEGSEGAAEGTEVEVFLYDGAVAAGRS